MIFMENIKFSFIIPVKEINDYIRESVPKILEIQREDFEILIYPDETNNEQWDKTRQIATGKMGPAEKRTLAIRDALGDILVFIDDDAYPENNFLDILEENFQWGEEIVAVGGPAITPPHNSFKQKISGAVFLSKLSHSHPERYAPIGDKKFVDDWPSVNLSVRKDVFESIGGFDCAYWPGEDTKFCLDLLEKLEGQVLYDPNLLVYHHRREGLLRHLKQLGNYGIHRGYFARTLPKTSFKFSYLIPSLFLLFIIIGGISSAVALNYKGEIMLFLPKIISRIILLAPYAYIFGWAMYAGALLKAFFDIRKYEKFPVALHALYYIFLTHIWYGWRFIQGFLFTRKLYSKLR